MSQILYIGPSFDFMKSRKSQKVLFFLSKIEN